MRLFRRDCIVMIVGVAMCCSSVAGAEPKDWQYTMGEPMVEARARWARIVQGEELARGKEVLFSPAPSYWLTNDDNDGFDLTDGKLSERIDDRIWFNKDAVGWNFDSGSESAAGVTMRIDLGSVQPVGQIAIRLLGGREQAGLPLPRVIEYLASTDGENYHSLQKMNKLWHSERELSDFKTNFYVAEDGVAFMHPFVCAVPVQARWIAIRIMPENGVYTDQISVLKTKPGVPLNELKSFPRTRVFTKGLVVMPKLDSMVVTTNITTPNWLLATAYGKDISKDNVYAFRLKLPKGLRLHPNSEPSFTELKTTDGTRQYLFDKIALSTSAAEGKNPLYIEPAPGEKVAKGAKASFTGIINGADSQVMEYPVQLVTMPIVPDEMSVIFNNCVGWTSDYYQIRWPGFEQNTRAMGFDLLSIFSSWWDVRDGKLQPASQPRLEYVRKMQAKGFRIVQMDSPTGYTIRDVKAAKQYGTYDEKETEALYNQVDGKPGKYFSPLYRGKYFQEDVQRAAALAKMLQPDEVHWDIENWYEPINEAAKDPRAQEACRKSGKKWEDFKTDLGTEILTIYAKAVREAVPGKNIKIGLYNSDVKHHIMDFIFEWKKLYPHILDMPHPSVYVQGRAQEVAERVRLNYESTGKRITVPWLTAGTYGEFEPRQMEPMVYEAILNGAGGLTSYYFPDYDPMDYYYQSKALATLGRYLDLMKTGKPVPFRGDNENLHYTCFSSDREALIIVGNYSRSRNTKVSLPVPLKGAGRVAFVDGKPLAVRNGRVSLDVPVDQFRLLHVK